MLNYIWAFMIIIGIIIGAINGNMAEVTNAALESSKDAVSLCITMLGIMALWSGIMKIATTSGIIDKMTKGLGPVMGVLFPGVPKEHEARRYMATNMVANVLGLGWAATPAGLKSMEKLRELNNNSKIASDDMCAFLIINISSLQLIPVNIIAYRSQYNSANPAEIIMPAILATMISTIAGVIFIKLMRGRRVV